ncbi:trypsin-like peptidase domain-containing protein [Streptomyces sp. NPDC002779]|uniref:effector-associated domain 2-containing protein n=1 Tax=Streptomyces sp. NPDC002779 TaxID=3364664 RepID=UPI00369235CA
MGPDPERVAEVRTGDGLGRRRGSGYLVGDRWVLTCAHAVGDARETAVRLNGTEAAPARVALASEKADVALLEMTRRVADCEPPPYGAVPQTATALPFTASGYAGPHGACRTGGTISALPHHHHRGVLELTVERPGGDPGSGRPPWEGMSGAAVWHDGTLIGLVSTLLRGDDPSRLAAVRVDHWYELLTGAELALLHQHAGLPATPAELSHIAAPVTLAHLPENLPLRELDGLVTALTALPSVSDRNGLALILDGIDPVISAMSPRSPALRPDVFAILRTCLRYRGTLDQLLEAIRLVEGDSVGVARMDQEAVELSRRHR